MRLIGSLAALSIPVITSASPGFRDAHDSVVPVIRTDFSGATIPVRVGHTREAIQVQLSFTHPTSFLYSAETCPPFIRCFSSASSSSRNVTSDLKVGSTIFRNYNFAVQIYEDDVRDTAGMLSFSPKSSLARNFAAHVCDEWFGYRHEGQTFRVGGLSFDLLNETMLNGTSGSVEVSLLPLSHSDQWSFEATNIRLNGEKVSTRSIRVIVDPTITPIVIPHEYRSVVRDILELQVEEIYEDPPSEDLYLPCTKEGPSKARLDFDIFTPSGSVRIRPFLSPLFPLRKIVHSGTYFCQTHFRFGSRLPTGPIDRHTWIIGQPLFRERPQGVLFDSLNNRMVIGPSGPTPTVTLRFSVLPVTMRMPRYDPNIVIERPNDSLTILKFKQGSNPDEGYVVRSRRLIGGRGVGMLDFSLRNVDDLRSRKSAHDHQSSSPSGVLDGLYHILDDTVDLRFNDEEKSISLYLTRAVSLDLPIYSVSLLHTSSISMISLRQVSDAIVDSGDLLLPAPVVVNETSTTEQPVNSCCICICDFETGESVQGLPHPCPHKFHEACIKQWFSTGKRNCPLCQFEVPIGENPSITRPSPNPDSVSNAPSIYDVFASILFAFDSQHMMNSDEDDSR